MKKFTEKDIKFLIESGFLVPRTRLYGCYGFPTKKRKPNVFGYPVIMEIEEFKQTNPKFPFELLTQYTFSNILRRNQEAHFYIVPYGIDNIKQLSKTDNLNKLKEWLDLSQIYVNSEITDQTSQVEVDLLRVFRELYYLDIKSQNLKIEVVSDIFLDLFPSGLHYRKILNENFNIVYDESASHNEFLNLIIDKFESAKDIALYEDLAIKKSTNVYNGIGFNYDFAQLWYSIVYRKYGSNKYNEQSPFLQKFRSQLYRPQLKKNAASETISLLSWLEVYDFQLIKEDFLNLFNNSAKKDIIKYVTKVLKENNALPEISKNLLLKEDIKIIHTNTLSINLDLIKTFVENSNYGAETLIALAEKSFKESELECHHISYEIVSKDGIAKFLIESLSAQTTKELSDKLVKYLNAAVSADFLTPDMIKLLIKHGVGIERKKYEYNKDVMEKYLKIKKVFLLKRELETELKNNKEKKKVNKI